MALKCGHKQSIETKRKISTTLKIAYHEGRKKINPNFTHLGRQHTKIAKKKMSLAKEGKHVSPITEFKKGYKMTREAIQKRTESRKRNGWNKNPELANQRKSCSMKKNGFRPKEGFKSGEKHPNWNNGSSFEPYGLEFNNKLRGQIRNRDQYRCQQCFRHQNELNKKLAIHHIDFNKKNNALINLISLCHNCHSQTNFNREDWTEYFQNRMFEAVK